MNDNYELSEKKSSKGYIIGIIVVVVICCCCVAMGISSYAAWTYL